MSVKPPSPRELERIARTLHIDLSEEELASYARVAAGTLGDYGRLDELADTVHRPDTAGRDPGQFPDPQEDPHHGWVWRCSVSGAPEGPLAGNRIAIKDNIAMAGLPMLNGTPVMEGRGSCPARTRPSSPGCSRPAARSWARRRYRDCAGTAPG